MKKYTQPSIELTKFDVEDVIMASDPAPSKSLGKGTTVTLTDAQDALTGYTVVEW